MLRPMAARPTWFGGPLMLSQLTIIDNGNSYSLAIVIAGHLEDILRGGGRSNIISSAIRAGVNSREAGD